MQGPNLWIPISHNIHISDTESRLRSELGLSHCVWAPQATCAGSVTSGEHCKMLRFLWQRLYNTEARRPHTARRDPKMRVNKPGEPSLTPCVAAYSADWWENKAGSSMINTSPFLRMICYGWVSRFDLMASLWGHRPKCLNNNKKFI